MTSGGDHRGDRGNRTGWDVCARSDLSGGRRGRPRVTLAAAAVLAHEHPLERLPEHLVENGVEHRVDHGTGVAQPRDQVDEALADVGLAVRAHGRQQIEREERRPQEHEREEHDAQNFGGLLLQPDDAAVPVRVADHHARPVRVVRPLRRHWLLLPRRQAQRRPVPDEWRMTFAGGRRRGRGRRLLAYWFLRHGPAQWLAADRGRGQRRCFGLVGRSRPHGQRVHARGRLLLLRMPLRRRRRPCRLCRRHR